MSAAWPYATLPSVPDSARGGAGENVRVPQRAPRDRASFTSASARSASAAVGALGALGDAGAGEDGAGGTGADGAGVTGGLPPRGGAREPVPSTNQICAPR